MATPTPPPGYGTRTTLTPVREYELPGGPFSSNLGETTVTIKSEFERGSDQDRGTGGNR